MAAGAFSRHQKISLQTLVYSILNYRGKTQKMELRNFLKVSRSSIAISTWGYTKARLKINPDAFISLRDYYLEGYYCEENKGLLNYKGYIPVAIDGSDLHIPYTEENRLIYGDANSRSEYPVVMASCSCAYDVCNDMILDCTLERYKRTERESARDHIKKIEGCYSQEFLYLFDRGYPSAEFLIDLMENGQAFLFRLDQVTFKREQQSLKEEDAWVDIILDRTRINPYRGTPLAEKMRQVGKLRLRMTKIQLPNGTTELLLSNLPDEQFSSAELAELYHMRWKIETMYDCLKNKLQIENFSGKLQRIIAQDFYATIYLYNLISDIRQDAQSALSLPACKYGIKTNQTMAIGIVKDGLIQMASASSGSIRSAIFKKIVAEIQAHVIPIRSDRHFARNTAPRKTKYSITRKNSY